VPISDIFVSVEIDLIHVFYCKVYPVAQLNPPFGARIRPVGYWTHFPWYIWYENLQLKHLPSLEKDWQPGSGNKQIPKAPQRLYP